MWRCPICGVKNEKKVCAVCDWDETKNYEQYFSAVILPDKICREAKENWVNRKQEYRLNFETVLPLYPGVNYHGAYANQAVSVARSYWNAKMAQVVTYTYQGGHSVFEGEVSDRNKKAMIDCSTYMGLVLRGISFEDSPYRNISAIHQTCDAKKIKARSALYPWADYELDKEQSFLKGKVRSAADIAKYMYFNGRCFTDGSKAMPGDLVFCAGKKADGSYQIKNCFQHVSHVGMIAEYSEEMSFYNATNYSGVVLRTRISNRRDIVFYARPNYERRAAYPAFDKHFNLLCAPWYDEMKDYGVNQVQYEKSGVIRVKVNEPSFHMELQKTWLEPGTYRLSSGVKYLYLEDGGSQYGLGLTVRNVRDGVILAHCSREYRGNEEEFTLAEVMQVEIFLEISVPNESIWKPKLVRIG